MSPENSQWHLAQLNVGVLAAPLDSDQLRGFVDRLEPVNAQADAAPGFVWRLQDDSGNATALRGSADNVLVNMSVWEDLESLRSFVYRSAHVDVLRDRADYFLPMDEAYMVLWWVPAGHIPDLAEAEERLAELRANGPTESAFTFNQPFPAPREPATQTED